MWKAFLDHLPRGNTLGEEDWQRRHRLLLLLLALHIPGLALFGLFLGQGVRTVLLVLITPTACLGLGALLRHRRRPAAVLVTAGLVYCSAALVGITNGSIESHFHFFIIIGFIALYQDWAPFLFNILFTVISHGVGSIWQGTLMFNHPAGQANPWLWSLIHGGAVLFACVGMTLFWRVTEDQQQQKDALARKLAETEIGRRQFTSELLVNLARRNQSMLYRQLDIINQLEETERDPDALAELFKLDHLATRVRRNAESLLVLSGEQPARVWSDPVPLRDVVRAAIAETEDLDRVVFTVDERPAVAGHTVTDLTHLLAELTENAVRFSPPDTVVTIRARPDRTDPGGHLLTVEDWGVGMPPDELATANALLAEPPEVDLSVSQRLGFHVVARLAARHNIRVALTATPGSGITAIVTLPSGLFEPERVGSSAPRDAGSPGRAMRQVDPVAKVSHRDAFHPSGPHLPDPVPAGRAQDSASPVAATVQVPVWQPAPGPEAVQPDRTDDWRGWWDPPAEPAEPAPAGPEWPALPREGSPAVSSPEVFPPPAPQRAGSPADRASAPGPVTPVAESPTLAPPPAAPRPRPAPSSPAPAGNGVASPVRGRGEVPPTPPGGLRRRVPQASLAPELRRAAPEPGPAVTPGHSAEAASALSRYQASRQAASAVVDGGPGAARSADQGRQA